MQVTTEIVRQPMYQQLNALLRQIIHEGAVAPGQQFLTEREVCERFSVSRPTANKSLASLVSEGLLEFRKGVGTFVRPMKLDYDLQSLVSFTEKALAAGKKPSSRVLGFARIEGGAAGDTVAAALSLSDDDEVYWMRRLRLCDDQPVILETRWVVARYCPHLRAQDVTGSLYQLWTQRYGLRIEGAQETIRAVNLAADQAVILDAPAHAAALEVEAIGRLHDNGPLWYEQTLYRADRYEFRNHLGPIRTARPAVGDLIVESTPRGTSSEGNTP